MEAFGVRGSVLDGSFPMDRDGSRMERLGEVRAHLPARESRDPGEPLPLPSTQAPAELGLVFAGRRGRKSLGHAGMDAQGSLGAASVASRLQRALESEPPESKNGRMTLPSDWRASIETLASGHCRGQATIINELGMHARPATLLVELANRFRSDIRLKKGNVQVNGKSIIDLLTLSAEMGTNLVIEANGEDAHEALESICRLIANGFGELEETEGSGV